MEFYAYLIALVIWSAIIVWIIRIAVAPILGELRLIGRALDVLVEQFADEDD